ncbi:MAG: class I SAM-dependent methyltransferase [Raineya sp.]|nr:class I SAM-dependent methyltransferase [Raineya sp.]MDW8297349.1 class I SAM-dependent methyltransferase [Raineya sp.]
MFSTTEITSNTLISDNPIHQRLFFAYWAASQMIEGDILEIGCGLGRGLEVLFPKCNSYTALDKNEQLIEKLQRTYPVHRFITHYIPPLESLEDESFDFVICFQVIEHIRNDKLLVQEIHRVLKPKGKLLLSTPNIKQSLTRNPWHVREYTAESLENLLRISFNKIEKKGVWGNEKVQKYHEENRKAVAQWKKWDFLNLEHLLPRWLLQTPYTLLNRINRNRLLKNPNALATQIDYTDYHLTEDTEKALDLFFVAEKEQL